jgi:hypothetical protein
VESEGGINESLDESGISINEFGVKMKEVEKNHLMNQEFH